jgi:hypothetical protein
MIHARTATKSLLIAVLLIPAFLWADGEIKNGTYSVPGFEEQTPLATFANEYVVTKTPDGKVSLSYNLPEDLVGADPVEINLRGEVTPGATRFTLNSGEGYKADCSQTADHMKCNVNYWGLMLDPDNTAAFLESKYGGKDDLPLRQSIARAFDVEPRGVVSF